MLNNRAVVSIIIPTYNRKKYLKEALLSVFGQTYKNYEVIVVDDGSLTDQVKKICGRHADRIRYIHQENRGLSGARNTGIRNSAGEYIAFLDDDDCWEPEKLDKQVRRYEELKARGVGAGLVYTGAQECSEEGVFLYNHLWKSSGHNYDKLIFVDFIAYGGSSVMTTRAVLDDVGLFDESIRCAEDYDLWLRIARKYPLYSVDEFLVKFRNKRNSLSKNPAEMIRVDGLILQKILKDGLAVNALDEGKKNKIIKSHDHYAALRWKNAAYDRLFNHSDAKTFREYAGKGRALDESLFGFKVWIYWLLSYVSPRLCRQVKQIKKDRRKDIIMNVDELKF